jgi:hypothetical protein
VRTFIDPERHEEWRVFVDLDWSRAERLVFEREYRVYADAGRDLKVDDLSEDELLRLFRLSYREFQYDDGKVWRVCWEEQRNHKTWTWFESASGERRVIKAQLMFPFIRAEQLANALRRAAENAVGPP